jgi:hypothetical protein
MRLENERNAFDSGGVRTFASFRETLLDELFRLGEQSNAFASLTFATEVVLETFAIGGLRKHSRQSEFAETARPAEEQSVRNAIVAQSTAQSRDNAFIAKELGKAHASAALLCKRSH